MGGEGGGGKGGQKVIKEGSETTEGGVFGENERTEDHVIGIRGEGDNCWVDFYHKDGVRLGLNVLS